MNRTLRIRTADRQVFDDLQSGRKTIETRAATPKYQKLVAGDTLTFVCREERLVMTVKETLHWKSVESMARAIGWQKVMPHASSLKEVKETYASYPGYTEKIREHGIAGFRLR